MRTLKCELEEYANACIIGFIASGRKHKWACQRFLNDILRDGKDIYWDEEEAAKIVLWFSYLRHSKGVLAKQPVHLNSWQKFCLCQIYGWRRADGRKRFTQTFIEVGRKNAKSQMEAGCILYEMATQSVKNGEIYECYCAGTRRDQSKIIFQECKNLLLGSPLQAKFKITRDIISHKKTGSFLKPLSKEDRQTGDGTNPAVLVLDEYHQHKTTEFYALGLGADTKEPLLMIITTAGMDLTYPCYTQEYSYCESILDPNKDVENDAYFVDICEIDATDDPFDESVWLKANPIRATYKQGMEKLRSFLKIAEEIPEKMPEFLTKCLNIWIQAQENGYMDMGKWKHCMVQTIPYDLRGRAVFVGFDMSAKIDLTSVSFVIPIQMKEKKPSGEARDVSYYAVERTERFLLTCFEETNTRSHSENLAFMDTADKVSAVFLYKKINVSDRYLQIKTTVNSQDPDTLFIGLETTFFDDRTEPGPELEMMSDLYVT